MGEIYEVKEFLEIVFGYVNFNWQNYVVFDECYLCFVEVDLLIGDLVKIKV